MVSVTYIDIIWDLWDGLTVLVDNLIRPTKGQCIQINQLEPHAHSKQKRRPAIGLHFNLLHWPSAGRCGKYFFSSVSSSLPRFPLPCLPTENLPPTAPALPNPQTVKDSLDWKPNYLEELGPTIRRKYTKHIHFSSSLVREGAVVCYLHFWGVERQG